MQQAAWSGEQEEMEGRLLDGLDSVRRRSGCGAEERIYDTM